MEITGQEPALSSGEQSDLSPMLSFCDRIRLGQLTEDERDRLDEGWRILTSPAFMYMRHGFAVYRGKAGITSCLVGFNEYQAIAQIDPRYKLCVGDSVSVYDLHRGLVAQPTDWRENTDSWFAYRRESYGRYIDEWIRQRGYDVLPNTKVLVLGKVYRNEVYVPELSYVSRVAASFPEIASEIEIKLDLIHTAEPTLTGNLAIMQRKIGIDSRLNTIVLTEAERIA